MTLTFRKARAEDSEILLRWRNDPLTREQSIQPGMVAEAEHQAWFTATLARRDRELFIVIGDGEPIGMVRFDSLGEHWEMSWSLAPEKRGLGWGKRLVSEGARLKEGKLVARIKRRNPASERIAQLAGFCFVEEKDGVGHWRRDKI